VAGDHRRDGVAMPPHCDSLDGPVVSAARRALDANDADLVVPYVDADGEAEVREAFDRTVKVRALGPEAQELADRWFFETVVRVHRAGEGASFTGLKPSGLDVGPVIPVAERALEDGIASELEAILSEEVRHQVHARLDHAMALKAHAGEGVPEARAYVDAMLGLEVWAHHVHQQVLAGAHEHR
jgi:hypothetical protein